jgi:glucose/arabinose dehydrogenase
MGSNYLTYSLGLFLSAVAILSCTGNTRAATVPTGFTDSLVANGLTNPTAMALAPDGRIFVCEQGGKLRVIKNGALLATPFLSLTVDSAGERGLLGVAFDPNFVSNQLIYVYYTVPTPAHTSAASLPTATWPSPAVK